MDIRYTILGFLDWKPHSGYDLKKRIARSDLFYWSGNNNQIYTALTQLHKEGLVSQAVEIQETLPARKIYSITAAGREEFVQWQRSRPELPEFQHNFLIQLAWTENLSNAEMDLLLERYEEEIIAQLKMRLEMAARDLDRPGRSRREKFIWQRIDINLAENFSRELEWVRALRNDLHGKVFEE